MAVNSGYNLAASSCLNIAATSNPNVYQLPLFQIQQQQQVQIFITYLHPKLIPAISGPKEIRYPWNQIAHSWFATVVDDNELGPVYPFQLKQLEYEDP